jgi:hypothetical protein
VLIAPTVLSVIKSWKTPRVDCRYEDSSVRRQTTGSYLDAVDWTDPRQVLLL